MARIAAKKKAKGTKSAKAVPCTVSRFIEIFRRKSFAEKIISAKKKIDRLYRRKDITGLLAKLLGCMNVELSEKGIMMPLCSTEGTAESLFTASYILEKLKALPGGSLAIANLVSRFKNGKVNSKGVSAKDQKKADELYHKHFMEESSRFAAGRSPYR